MGKGSGGYGESSKTGVDWKYNALRGLAGQGTSLRGGWESKSIQESPRVAGNLLDGAQTFGIYTDQGVWHCQMIKVYFSIR